MYTILKFRNYTTLGQLKDMTCFNFWFVISIPHSVKSSDWTNHDLLLLLFFIDTYFI